MASVRSVVEGRWEVRVRFEGKRHTVRLGKCDESYAKTSSNYIQELADAQTEGDALSRRCRAWLDGISDDVRRRLTQCGLIEATAPVKQPKRDYYLGSLCKRFLDSKRDKKQRTVDKLKQTTEALLARFGQLHDIRRINKADAQAWRAWLKSESSKNGKQLASATVNRRTGDARQVFRFAIDAKLLTENPFAPSGKSMSTTVQANQERQEYVDPETISQLLTVCDPEWECIIALARFGGLRVVSETYRLDWKQVDFRAGRIKRLKSQKTAHHEGKQERDVPLFPDLHQILHRHKKRSGPVTPSYQDENANLRTQLHSLCERAAIEPWPRGFTNLRSSCITDLLRDTHDIKAVAKWMGNTPKVIMQHYEQLTSDMEAAALAKVQSRLP